MPLTNYVEVADVEVFANSLDASTKVGLFTRGDL